MRTATEEQSPDAEDAAWTLFSDRDSLEREMTALANSRLAAAGAFAEAASAATGGPSA